MKANKYIALLLISIGCAGLFAQAPGYMGKRLNVGYGFYFNPMLSGSNARNKTLNDQGGTAQSGKFALNITHQAFIEYAVSERWSLGLGLNYFRTGYDNRQAISPLGKPTDFYIINNFGCALYSKHFFKRFVAPWGSYFMTGLVVNATTSSHHDFMYLKSGVNDRDTLLFDFGKAKQTQVNFDVLIGFGKTRIIANKFTVDYGFTTQLGSLFKAINPTDYTNITRDDYINVTTRDRVKAFACFNLFIKLGYLF